jgi:hypothetical protein
LDVANSQLPPTLLFQATDDAATPYEGGVRVHRLLARSSLVVEQGGGNHGITLSGNACLDKYLSDYLADGTVPHAHIGPANAVCEKTPEPKPVSEKAAAAAPAADSRAGRGAALHRLVGFRG